jgi:hypothetical protein
MEDSSLYSSVAFLSVEVVGFIEFDGIVWLVSGSANIDL